MSRFAGCVFAFDLDNTLLDPGGAAYHRTVSEFLSRLDLGAPLESVFADYEAIRLQGDALARLGIRNPNHDRGNADALAVLLLTRDLPDGLRQLIDEPRGSPHEFRSHLQNLSEKVRATRALDDRARLEAELRVRTELHLFRCPAASVENRRQTSSLGSDLSSWVGNVRRLASQAWLREWADSYREIERRHPPSDPRPLLEWLANHGAIVVVITEGRVATQKEKIERLGLTEFTRDRALISQAAGQVRGADRLHARIDQLLDQLGLVDAGRVAFQPIEQTVKAWTPGFCERVLDEVDSDVASAEEALGVLWPVQSLIRAWSRKTTPFFARCLHAIRHDLRRCESALAGMAWVSDDEWHREPLRLVMVGDRYDRDIRPLIDLLGSQAGYRIRLAQGKYGTEYPDSDLSPAQRPNKTVRDWAELVDFVTQEFDSSRIGPLVQAPPLSGQRRSRL